MGIKKAQGGSISDCRSWIIKKAEAEVASPLKLDYQKAEQKR
ncbi:MAG TPA: hypothetical protein VLA13_05460 [Massilibacterium sp.]|nr:hypothetical protein [Massilibacterium sp.]